MYLVNFTADAGTMDVHQLESSRSSYMYMYKCTDAAGSYSFLVGLLRSTNRHHFWLDLGPAAMSAPDRRVIDLVPGHMWG